MTMMVITKMITDDGQVFHEGPTKSHWTHPVFLEVVFLIEQYFPPLQSLIISIKLS